MAPIATLTVRLSAQVAEFQSEFRNATKSAQKFSEDFEGIATRASAVGTFIGNIATKIASSLASAFGQGLKDAVRLSSEFANAFTGLTSVARAFGADADLAKEAARQLSSDGLLPLKDSAAGLKNLLATGFNLEQSTRLMNAFKDSAAFGRAGALSFGDAIRTATEGVKNGNSILVDNAGITKNLSQILKEAGFSAQDLSKASSDAGVRMALYNGILKESAAFTGDAARLTETYSGQVARLETSYNALLGTIGDSITQNATVARTIGAISDAILGLNGDLTHSRNALNFVSDGVIFLVRTFAEVINAVDLVQTAFAGLQIYSNRLFEAFANIGIAIFKFTESASNVQKYLDPINFKRHAAAADEARQAYVFLEGAAQGLRDASKGAQERSIAFGNSLQTIRKGASDLADELQATRGKTVELGTSANVTGAALRDGLAKGAETAAQKAKELRDALKSVKDEITSVDAFVSGLSENFNESFAEGMKAVAADFDFLKDRFQETVDSWESDAKEGVTFVADEIKRLEDIIGSFEPKPPTGFQKYFGGWVGAAQTGINAFANAIEQGFNNILDIGKNFAKEFATAVLEDLLSFVPGVGQQLKRLARPIIEFFGGLFDRNKGRDSVQAFADSFGGFDSLQKRLGEMGAEGERLWIKLTQGVGRNNPAQAAAVIAEVTAALDAFGTEAERAQRRLDGLGSAVDGVNRKAELFADPFRKLIDARKGLTDEFGKDADPMKLKELDAKLAETAQRTQGEFERIGVFVAAAFGGLVKETGDALGAISQLGPAFAVLQQGVAEFGLTSTGTIDALLEMFALVNDAVTGPILQSIQATGQIFSGLQQAGVLTSDLFQTVATDIGASFRELEAKGGDVAKAMALSQPILQKLWEGQQTYGAITDDTTRALLEQAEQQGLVGAHMKDVNQKILDVLIAIADVFGATIPDALRGLPAAAQTAADGIEDALGRIKFSPITIPVDYDLGNLPDRPIVPFARGGIVRRPTLALIGEAGPEAVVPLSQYNRTGGGAGTPAGSTTINVTVNGPATEGTARLLAREIAAEIRLGGDVLTDWQGLPI